MKGKSEIPLGWEAACITDIVDVARPVTYGVVQPGERQSTGIPLIRGKDYSSGEVSTDDLYLIHPTIARAYSRSIVKGNDILLSIVGYVGLCAAVPHELIGANITQTTARIAIRKGLSYRFFLHQFRAPEFQAQVRRFMKGSAQPGLNLADVEKMRVLVPPLHEQRRIAEILDTADEAIRSTEQVIAKLEHVKQGLLHDILTRGIWQTLRIGSFTRVGVGYVGPIAPYFTSSSDGVPLLSTTNIENSGIRSLGIRRVTRAFDRANNKSRLAIDDIIVARHGDSGESAVIPPGFAGAQCLNVVVIRQSSAVYSAFLARLLSSEMMRRRILATKAGSVQGVVNTSEIESLVVPIPPIAEQRDILDRVNACERREAIETQTWVKLRALKQGLMDDLLAGRVQVGASA